MLTARRSLRHPAPDVDPGRAFDLRTPVILALAISAVLVVAGALNEAFGARGAVLASGVAGFGDAQSAAVSAASLTAAGRLGVSEASIAALAG